MTERLDDGFPTTIAFASGSSGVDFLMYEKEVTPPGVSGGGANDITTMRNDAWRTNKPKVLKTLSPASFVGAYDPEVFDEIVVMVNLNQLIIVTFPDESTLTFWGWIDEFTPNAIVEGEQPTANITIIPSNWDDDNNIEYAPLYAA